MKRAVLFFHILTTFQGFAQCTYPATIQGTNSCIGATLKVNTSHTPGKIVWYQDNTAVDSVTATRSAGSAVYAAGGTPVPFTITPYSADIINVAVADNGDLFITDDTARVYKWSSLTRDWSTVAGGNGIGSNADQLAYPTFLFVDKQENIYVCDGGNHRIQKWAPGASSGVTVAGNGGQGPGASQLAYPCGVYVDCSGNIFVADSYNNRIQKWAAGDSTGTTVAGGHGLGANANQLHDPTGLWLDGNGNIYIADAGNNRIQKWAPGAAGGITLASSPRSEINTNNLIDPFGLFVDFAGDMYISNAFGDRIMLWTPDATAPVTLISGHPEFGFGAFMDSKGNLLGMAASGNRLLELQQTFAIDATFKPSTGGRYHAIVTDINGYTVSTDTFAVFAPSNPSPIQIGATATDVNVCTPVTFTAAPSYPPSSASYQWQVSGVDVGGDSVTWSNNLFANGDRITCILTTADNSCDLVQDTSNAIVMSVDPQGHPTVTITASDTSVCAGTTITFTATVTNGSATPAFEWLVNGVATNDTTSEFSSTNLSGGNVVYCLITSDASCGLAKSNSIPVFIYPVPTIAAGQIITIPYGKSEMLDPIVNGDVASYTWTPGSYLSDSTIRNPVADPPVTTVYTLRLVSPGGCKASGSITVDVYTPLSLPGAFTPNGDGHNDILYVLGAPANTLIREFTIFDRWGASVFESHNATPGDARQGWNGTSHGHPEPAGTYVYIVLLALPNGMQKMYKGTVVLIR
jgi:gliding motility-associated-like protein